MSTTFPRCWPPTAETTRCVAPAARRTWARRCLLRGAAGAAPPATLCRLFPWPRQAKHPPTHAPPHTHARTHCTQAATTRNSNINSNNHLCCHRSLQTTCDDGLTVADWVDGLWSPVVHHAEDINPDLIRR